MCFDWTRAAGSETAQLLCNKQRMTGRRSSRLGIFVAVCDERVVSVSLCKDGLVQAAALREGLQRFLHQDRHQKGSQVSDVRMKHT